MGFSQQEYWSGLPFPSPVDHILLELSTMTCPSWVALHGMAHSFIELDKAVVHVISLIFFFCDCGFHSVCPVMEKVRDIWKLPGDWLWVKLGLALVGAILTDIKSTILQYKIKIK